MAAPDWPSTSAAPDCSSRCYLLRDITVGLSRSVCGHVLKSVALAQSQFVQFIFLLFMSTTRAENVLLHWSGNLWILGRYKGIHKQHAEEYEDRELERQPKDSAQGDKAAHGENCSRGNSDVRLWDWGR